jgi:glutamyl-tRNA reductase
MNTPELFLVGATHRTAPFGFRERLALGPEAEAGFAQELTGMRSLCEFAILNTCNRIEIYGVATEECATDQVAAAFRARQNVGAAEFGKFGFAAHGHDAVQSSFGSLLRSRLADSGRNGDFRPGEACLRDCAISRISRCAVLNRLFQKAFQAAKHIRTTTAVTTGQISVANVAVDLAQRYFWKLGEHARILLLGAGEMGEKSGRAFASRGAKNLMVCSRKSERASQLAAGLGAAVLPFEEREARLAEWDIIVCSTAAPSTVISASAVRAAMRTRPHRPILFVDLAMPRDVDAAAADAANVFLYNLDDLAQITEKNRVARRAEAERGRLVLMPRADSVWWQVQTQLLSGGGPNSPAQEARAPDRGMAAAAFA